MKAFKSEIKSRKIHIEIEDLFFKQLDKDETGKLFSNKNSEDQIFSESIRSDWGVFEGIFYHLIKNAIKYSYCEGLIKIRLEFKPLNFCVTQIRNISQSSKNKSLHDHFIGHL